jgi:formylglycine-generating enzyme required for sulfatase activity
MLRLAGDLLAMQELSQERAGWLQTYIERFPSGAAGFSRDPLRAAATVLNEVEEDRLQRANLLLEFFRNEALQKLLAGAGKLTAKQATALTADLAARYGFSISTQAVASVLSALSVGLTVNSILYGTDDLVANFQLAQRAEELRTTFQAGRAMIQAEAAERAEDGYDGDLAVAYRTAVLLDTLAGAAAYHAYAEGVAATQRTPNLLTLLITLLGEDWQAAAEGLHRSADNAERTVLNDLDNPTMLDAAVTLALTRVRPQTTADGETLVEPTTGMAFVFVPAGEFEMGSTDGVGYGDEQPQHTVALDAYWIGQTEVTNAQFQQFVDAGGYAAERYWSAEGWQVRSDAGWEGPRCLEDDNVNAPDQPVVCVSWYEADAYTRWLSESTGETYRLPTEAEWEKAARGTDGRTFPWGDLFDGSRLNFCDVNCEANWKDETYDDGYAYTAPVGSYAEGASPYGALDMGGNVWEWVNDRYDGSYYSQSPSENPQGPATGKIRLLRGGSWYFSDSFVRSAIRYYFAPDDWDFIIGFRCVRSQ